MAADNSKLRVLLSLFLICLVVGAGLAYLVHHHRTGSARASAGVVGAPNIQSLPGEGDPSELYVKTQQEQNALLVQQARREGTSAVPTITRPSFIGNLETLQEGSASAANCPLSVNGVSIVPTPGSCSVENLKLARIAGVSAQELRCQACSCPPLKEAGFDAADLKSAGFSALDLKNCGFTLAQLVQAGFNAAELKAAGFSAAELKAAGFTAAELKAAGFTAQQLADAGFTATQLKDAGFSAADLKAAGFTSAQLKDAGFTAAQLKAAGFSAADLKAAGFTAQQLADAGFDADALKAAGFTPQQIAAALATNKNKACDVNSMKKARAEGASATAFKDKSCSLAELIAAGYTPAELKAAGFTAAQLKAAGFSAEQLKDAGFNAAELKAAGFTAAQLKAAGFDAAQLKAAGFNAADLKAAGFTAAQLKNAGFDAADLKAAGFNAAQLKAAGFTAAQLKDVGFNAKQLEQAGYSAGDLKAAGFSAQQLAAAGYTPGDLTRAGFSATDTGLLATGATGSCSVSALSADRAKGITAAQLKARGCSLEALKAAGFTAAELKAAGFTAEQLAAAGFSPAELQAAGFTAAELAKALAGSTGECSVAALQADRAKGITASQLKAQGCSLDAMKAAGYTTAELKAAGFTAAQLRAAGFTPAQLQAAGFGVALSSTDGDGAGTNGSGNFALPSIDQSTPQGQLARIRAIQAQQASFQQRQSMVQSLQGQMAAQASQLLSSWSNINPQTYQEEALKADGSAAASGAGAGGVNANDAAPSGPTFKAGSVMFAVIETSINSDEQSPILAKVVSGPLAGSTLLGQFTLVKTSLLLSFKTLNVPSFNNTVNINAVAIDPDTARTAVTGSVNNHYMLRYGTLFASSFLSGVAQAIQSSGSTTTGGGIFGTVTTNSTLDPGQEALVGLGSVGQQYSQVMASNFTTPPTVKIPGGTGIGLLLMSDLTLPADPNLSEQ